MNKPLMHEDEDVEVVAFARTTSVNVRCPGAAHTHGDAQGDPCVICDAENDGTVEVLVTHVERDALTCAARGRPFDRWLAPRLIKLGLLERRDGRLSPTAAGLSVVAELHASAS